MISKYKKKQWNRLPEIEIEEEGGFTDREEAAGGAALLTSQSPNERYWEDVRIGGSETLDLYLYM